jgi:putative FmdB family regulatory protein
MPTYGYECRSCGYTFDVFQSMKDDPVKTCPQCGKEVRRLINGGSGVIFKGSGFYVTDKGKAGSRGTGGSTGIGADAAAETGAPAAGKQDAPAASGETAASGKSPAAEPAGSGGASSPGAGKSPEKKAAGI